MWNSKQSAMLSIVVSCIVVAAVTAGVLFGPWFVTTWFTVYRGWSKTSPGMERMLNIFSWCYYPCAVFAYVTLYSLIRLLFNIRNGNTFIRRNVTYLRCISWCCYAVAGITLVGGVFYLPFLVVAVAAGFVGLMLRVVKNVMQSAVEIREENELTI